MQVRRLYKVMADVPAEVPKEVKKEEPKAEPITGFNLEANPTKSMLKKLVDMHLATRDNDHTTMYKNAATWARLCSFVIVKDPEGTPTAS